MIKLKTAISKDSKFIYHLYLELLKKGITISKNLIDYNSHATWFKDFLKSKNLIFIINFKKKKIGYVRYEKKRKKFEISIALKNKYQNKGIGKAAFELSKIKFKSNEIISKIVKNNRQSLKFFKNIDFKKYYETKKYIVLIYKS